MFYGTQARDIFIYTLEFVSCQPSHSSRVPEGHGVYVITALCKIYININLHMSEHAYGSPLQIASERN